MSQITTHILDTTKGKSAKGVGISLLQQDIDGWTEIAEGVTDADGRIGDLLANDIILSPGLYKLKVETKEYFDNLSMKTLYPFVEIVFEVSGEEHYHIPLLLNPYGYTTYKGF